MNRGNKLPRQRLVQPQSEINRRIDKRVALMINESRSIKTPRWGAGTGIRKDAVRS